MPAPGDPAVLLHKQGTAKCGAILPRGTQRLSIPSCSRAKPLAQDEEREDQAVRGPQNHRLVNLPQAPASCLASEPRRAHRRHTSARGVCMVQGNPSLLLNK